MLPQPTPTLDKSDSESLLTPGDFRALAAHIHRNSNLSALLFGGMVYSVVFGIIVGALATMWVGLAPVMACAVVYGLVLTLTLSLFWVYAQKDRQALDHLVRFVTCTQDVAMLGPLLDLKDAEMHAGDIYSHINEAVDEAVLRLLPLVQATHAGTLNKNQRLRMWYSLWTDTPFGNNYTLDNLPYTRGVLHTLEQIGDKHDLLEIEKLLVSTTLSAELRAAVQHCTETVRERLAREESKDVLLRADRKPETVGTLLRPSIENTATPPHQLLRSAPSETPPTEFIRDKT